MIDAYIAEAQAACYLDPERAGDSEPLSCFRRDAVRLGGPSREPSQAVPESSYKKRPWVWTAAPILLRCFKERQEQERGTANLAVPDARP